MRGLASKLEGTEISSATTATASFENSPRPQTPNDDFSDRETTLKKYKKAIDELRKAIKIRKGPWNSFEFEKLCDEPDCLDDLRLRNNINAVLISCEASINDRKGWSKFIHAVECVFKALSPPVKNILIAMKGAQSVMPFSLFDLPFNQCVDTFDKSIWRSVQRSISLNHRSFIMNQILIVDCR